MQKVEEILILRIRKPCKSKTINTKKFTVRRVIVKLQNIKDKEIIDTEKKASYNKGMTIILTADL